jgi:hypothetical protein
MAKKSDTTTTTPAAAQKKSTAGVPRITAAVVGMTPEQREVWFNEKCGKLSAAIQKEVRERLDAVNAGKYELKGGGQGQGKKVDFQKIFERVTVAELLDARKVLDTTIEAKRDAAILEIEQQEKELAERKAMLAS